MTATSAAGLNTKGTRRPGSLVSSSATPPTGASVACGQSPAVVVASNRKPTERASQIIGSAADGVMSA